jgi:hypothetical protein
MFKKYLFILLSISLARGQEPGTGTAVNRADNYTGPIVLVDKNCIDGEYILGPKEQFFTPDEFPSIQDLVSSFSSSNYMSFIYGVLERRYPTGKSIIEQAGGQSAVDKWLWNTGSASSVLRGLGMAIHEVGHGLDESTPENWYFISLDKDNNPLTFTTPGMHGEMTWSGSPQYSMERSLLLDDDQNYKRPPAQSSEITTSNEWGEGPFGCDGNYAETYLTGDPNNSSFEGGDQGYNSLIEEYTQYVNSLAYAYYFQDYFRPSSDRHAMYTWMWWNERYLRKIRNEHPDQYEYLFTNKIWLELILTLWGRAWLYLSTGLAGMQPDSDYLHQLVQQQEMLEEIQRIRDACDCDNPVELLPDQVIIGDKLANAEKVRHLSYYNYPNPFINRTTISLILTKKQNVTLDIFNCRGSRIQTLHSGRLDKGRHIFTWDGTDNNGMLSASGIYFYRVKVDNSQYKGKLIKQGRA